MSRVLITGASRGLGNYLLNYLSEFYDVVGISKGGTEGTIKCDVTDECQVREFFSKQKKFDVLINNAGIVSNKSFKDSNVDDWRSVLDVNVVGMLNVTKHALNSMQKGDRVINISSVASKNYSKTANVSYTASKYAVNGLTKHLAAEYEGIYFNCICPSQMKTDMCKDINLEKIKSNNFLNDICDLKDVANIVKFLIEDTSKFINSQLIFLDGGQKC